MKLIDKETLKKWNACEDGYNRFNELFPTGATLKQASDALISDGHPDWSNWLWERCKDDDEYCDQTCIITGYRGTATVGDYGTAIVGDYGTAIAMDYGTASVGNYGTAIVGDYGTASAGDRGTAIAGYCGTVSAGDYGIIAILYYCSKNNTYKKKSGDIGENGLKPNTPYIIIDGEFKEVIK